MIDPAGTRIPTCRRVLTISYSYEDVDSEIEIPGWIVKYSKYRYI